VHMLVGLAKLQLQPTGNTFRIGNFFVSFSFTFGNVGLRSLNFRVLDRRL